MLRGAAVNLKKVALEMGGKSPNIVFDDADFETAVDNALTAAFTHSGQVCSRRLPGDRPGHHLRPLRRGGRAAGRRDPARSRERRRHRGRSAHHAEHRAKVEGFVASGIAEGARLVAGGRRPSEPELQAGFFYRPTVFADVTREMRIVREEVFGPVLTIERFSTEDEADRARQRHRLWPGRRGLDLRRRPRPAGRRADPRHGTVWINDYNTYLPQAEWGGFKQSGIGRELGPTGLDEYREAKHVWQNTAPAPTGWFGG